MLPTMLSDREFDVLKRYKKGQIVEPSDEFVIHRHQSIGLCTSGLHIDPRTGEAVETSRLTRVGLDRVKQEEIYRSPLKRFFYALRNTW